MSPSDVGLHVSCITRPVGNRISEDDGRNKSRRNWKLNVQEKRLFSYIMDRHIRVKVTTHALRGINKAGGIDEYLLKTPYQKMDKELGLYWKTKIQKLKWRWLSSRPRTKPSSKRASSNSNWMSGLLVGRGDGRALLIFENGQYQVGMVHVRPSMELGMSVPKEESGESRLTWLRSQVIGRDTAFDSPFGRRRLTYADHTASGRCLRYVEDFITDNVLPFYGNTHTSDNYVGRRASKMVREARGYIKKGLGGGPIDALLFCGSGTTGAIKRLQEVIGVAVPSTLRAKLVDILPVEERWVVFVGPYEHHSNLLSWRQSLAEVIKIGIDSKGSIDMEGLRQKLRIYRNANRPILGTFSACSNVTGKLTDTRALAKLLHEFEGFASFDFAASGPYAKIDMKSGEIDGYDAIVLSPHKFLGGPGSPGILLMNKALYRLGSSPPTTCGGGTVDYVNGFDEKDTLYVEEIEERESGGTPPIIQITRAALAFWVKDYVGSKMIEKTEHRYIEEAIKRLLKHRNIEILGKVQAARQAILSFLIYSTTDSSSGARDKPLHGAFITSLLNDLFGIQARAGCACAAPYGHTLLGINKTQSLAIRSAIQKGYHGVKPGWTRISFPYYMSEEEFHFILDVLAFVADYGQRFLPLYRFDIRTGRWAFKRETLVDLLSKETNGHTRTSPPTRAENTNVCHDDSRTEILINEYASYFEQARRVAGLLPEFPRPGTLGEDMDLDEDLFYFRI